MLGRSLSMRGAEVSGPAATPPGRGGSPRGSNRSAPVRRTTRPSPSREDRSRTPGPSRLRCRSSTARATGACLAGEPDGTCGRRSSRRLAPVYVVRALVCDALFAVRELDAPGVSKALGHRIVRGRKAMPRVELYDRFRPRFLDAQDGARMRAVRPARVEDGVGLEAAVGGSGHRVGAGLAVTPHVEEDPYVGQRLPASVDRSNVDHLRRGQPRR